MTKLCKWGSNLLRRALTMATGVVLVATPLAAQQEGTITGTIVDQATERPLAGAQVYLVGTEIGTLTSAQGRYTLSGVPAGEHTIRAEMLGHGSSDQTVTVPAGGTVQVDFQMRQQALALDEIVVTGTAGEQRRRAIGNVVDNISGAIAERAAIETASDFLRGRSPGVVVQRGGGAPGTASIIRIRGQASMSGTNQPILYVDGVRVNSSMTTAQGGSNGAAVSRIDDFSPENIASIEIIKGPAAATLYGTEASSGVIHITTKRGAYNEPAEWTFSTRQGTTWFHDPVGHTPTNYGINPETGNVFGLNIVAYEKARGNELFSYGHNQEYSLQVAGGSSAMRYFLSGTVLDEEGVTPDSWHKRYNFRANVGANPRENITVDATVGVVLNRTRLPGGGSSSSALRSIWLAQPELLDTPRRGYFLAPLEAVYEKAQVFSDANRVTGGLTINHNALDWFTHRLILGLDVTDQKNTTFTPRLSPFAAQFWDARTARGSREVDQESRLDVTFDYSASAMYDLSEAWGSTSSVGLQINTKSIELTSALGEQFPAPGVEAIGGAAVTFGDSDLLENNTVGLYIQQQFAWEDRLFLTAAVRSDDNSAFGADYSIVTYPKVSASWVISEAPSWSVDFINALRLRAAFGASGQQPDVFDAIRTFGAATLPSGRPAVRTLSLGNPDLGPERTRELEVGWDASLWNNRVSFDFTFYNQRTVDAIVARDVAPSSGFAGSQFVNIGEVSNRGVEASLFARVFDRASFDWDVGLNVGTNRNRIEELGLEQGIQLGLSTRHEEGYPVASIFAVHLLETEVDAEGNVISVVCDDGQGGGVPCDEAPLLYSGHPDPNVQGSLSTTFTFGDRLRLDVMSDFKLGQSNYNTFGWWYYGSLAMAKELWVDRTSQDPNILGAGYLGGSQELSLWAGRPSGYWRLREVSLSWPIPSEWAQRIGASQVNASLSARNLAMIWTEHPYYPFVDPEVRRTEAALRGGDPGVTAKLPPLHSLGLSLRFTF